MNKFDLDIVFLGGVFPKNKINEILEKSIGPVQNAADALQWKFIEGLHLNNKNNINILNSLFIGSFPKRYKELFINTYEFKENDNIIGTNIGFINLPIIKFFSKYQTSKKHIKKWANNNTNKTKVIIGYAMTWNVVHSLKFAKKMNKNIITCLIVPDLPQYMNLSSSRSVLYNIFKNVEINLINHDCKYIDEYVLLTEPMKDMIGCSNYTVIEGISESKAIDKSERFEKITFLYTGTLQEKYGVKNLVDQFSLIDNDNIQLIICGYGELDGYIRDISKRDSKIKFYGSLAREEVLKLQNKADFLINPRPNNEEYTKFSFPSKILEYLSTGNPVLTFKLDGMPDEYDKYIYYFDENDHLCIKNKIEEVIKYSKNDLELFGKKAMQFVKDEKNSRKQVYRLLKKISEEK